MRRYVVPVIALCAILAVPTGAREMTVARDMREAATSFLATLDEAQRGKASFEFTSDERLNWHFIPRTRKGLPYYQMNDAQRAAALKLLKTGLSAKGFEKAEGIRGLEPVLYGVEGEKGRVPEQDGVARRNPDRYFFSVFGTPSADKPWGWRYEGHHVAQNWTIVGGAAVASSPQFFGANPAEVRSGPKTGLRVLAAEEDLARTLLASLDAAQQKTAIVSDQAPDDILTTNQLSPPRLDEQGIGWTALSAGQRKLLTQIIREYAFAQATKLGEDRMAQLEKAGFDGLRFAWLGSTTKGERHYYRIQGPTFLVEYDNTQNNANHIHCVWRDFNGDFGRDLLAEHYRESHNPAVAAQP
jgi:hypothetical protein